MRTEASRRYQIKGTTAKGFESVKGLYERNMNTLEEKGTQLCVYYNDKKVIDLWASKDEDFSPDSLVNVFSSGKSLETIAMASLVGEELLNYDDRITDYWPEFGQNGKQWLTVAELMRHESGLAAFDCSLATEDLLTENLKRNKIGSIIERQAQKYRPNAESKREYHPLARGWIINEVFRRIEPNGRTIGEFLRDEIGTPLGVDAFVGMKQHELERRAHVIPLNLKFFLRESLKPQILGRRTELNFFQLIAKLIQIVPAFRRSTRRNGPAPFFKMRGIGFFNEPSVAMGETPSANTHSNARSLAKIAAMMAAGGQLENKEYLTPSAWSALHDKPEKARMGIGTSTFTQGGVALFTPCSKGSNLEKAFNRGREGFYGWMGLGGSIF